MGESANVMVSTKIEDNGKLQNRFKDYKTAVSYCFLDDNVCYYRFSVDTNRNQDYFSNMDFLPDSIVEIEPPEGVTLRSSSKAPKNTSAVKLLNQMALCPGITQTQLAKAVNVSKQAVSQMLQRYGINANLLESFKTNRADIMAGLQETVAASLTEDDIKKASVRDRTILFGTLYDKERLERGQSTSNQSLLFRIVEESDQAE